MSYGIYLDFDENKTFTRNIKTEVDILMEEFKDNYKKKKEYLEKIRKELIEKAKNSNIDLDIRFVVKL